MKKAPFLLFFISMAFSQAIEASPVNEDLLKQMYKNISKPSPRRPEANHNNDRNSPELNFAYNQDGSPRKSAFSPRIKGIPKADS